MRRLPRRAQSTHRHCKHHRSLRSRLPPSLKSCATNSDKCSLLLSLVLNCHISRTRTATQTLFLVRCPSRYHISRIHAAMQTLFVVRCPCQCHSTTNHPLSQPGPHGILSGDPHCGRLISGVPQITVLCATVLGSQDIFIVFARIGQLDTGEVHLALLAAFDESLMKAVPPLTMTFAGRQESSSNLRTHSPFPGRFSSPNRQSFADVIIGQSPSPRRGN